MSEPEIRIGDTEREEALKALGEHMGAGRLDLDEYGDRSARVTTAKTRNDLLALFSDLPEPRPRFGAVAGTPPVYQPTPLVATPRTAVEVGRRFAATIVPLVGLVAVALFFFTKLWVFFLLVPAAAILIGAITGDDQRRRRRRR